MQNTVNKFRSCTSHKQSFCVANIMKTGYIYMFTKHVYILVWNQGYATFMFPYDCGTIPHSFEKNESSLKHNLNSSTRPIWFRRLGKLPGVFKHVWKYITMLNEFELRSAAVDQRKCNTLSWRQNCKQYQAMQLFSLAFIAQREISVYSLWSCMPVLHSQRTML